MKYGAFQFVEEVTFAGDFGLQELFSENILAKIWRVATRELEKSVSDCRAE